MADKYVVLHGLIPGGFTRGQVVRGSDLGDHLGRCLDLGAVRKATAAEAGESAVTFAEQPQAHTLEAIAADKDAEIARLKERVASLAGELTAATSLLAEFENQPRGKAAEKAAKALKGRIAELENDLAAKTEEAADLASRVAELEDEAATKAPPAREKE